MLDTFGTASHDAVLQLVIQIAVLLFAARLLGGIALRAGQPAVVGEILAGVILGPSLVSRLVPFVGTWLLPQSPEQGFMLEMVSLLGVMFLLVVTGLETDLNLIRSKAGTALGVGAGSLLVPFASSLALAYLLPTDLLVDESQRGIFALFFATALSISAIPVLAKVLIDLDLMRRDIGQTLLASGMIADVTGWALLGVVVSLADAGGLGPGAVIRTIGLVVIFLLVTASAGTWLVTRSLAFVQDRFRGPNHILSLIVVLSFAWGAFSHALHLEPVLGAFAIGILFGRSPRLPADTVHKLEGMTFGVFAPIFFAVAGLKVDIGAILQPRLLAVTLVVIGVATFGKVAGAYVGARFLSGQDHWSALAYGAGLNARGALEIIVATIGLSLGILTQEMFSIIVVMAIVTSVMTPVALRYAIRRVEMGSEEAQRLLREEALRGSFVGRIRRVLVPVRPRPEGPGFTREMQATLLNQLATMHDMTLTLFSATTPEERPMATRYLGEIRRLFDRGQVTTRVVTSGNLVEAILTEAEGDYDLLVLGAPLTQPSGGETLFGRVLDSLVKLSPCPTMVVRGMATSEDWHPHRILVPLNGTAASRSAAELGFAMAGPDVEMTGVHIVTPTPGRPPRGNLALDVTTGLERVAAALGRRAETKIRRAVDPETGILDAVGEFGADLLILGTSVRAGTTNLHLGPRVEFLVRYSSCPVVIVNT